jgi:hypothetical protein
MMGTAALPTYSPCCIGQSSVEEVMSIQPGECFAQVGVSHSGLWRVVDVMSVTGCAEPHARLARVDHPVDRKTVSLSALRDPRFFRQQVGTHPGA